ncbi:MAG TPA: hypothetical protein VFL42_05670 [Terriglobales bacterium]|nr:hypothetical protein [Terriglobales bacterium]
MLPLLLFALPSFFLVLRLWLDGRRRARDSDWPDLPRQFAIFFLSTYVIWWASLALTGMFPALNWPTGIAVAWPFLGILMSVAGCVSAFFAREGAKGKLFVANLLFLGLSLSSVIAPN